MVLLVTPNSRLKTIWVMKLAIIAREYVVSRRGKKYGAHCWCTRLVLMEHGGKCPKVPSQVLGAPANMGLLILSCFKEFEFGKWKYHRTRPKQTPWRLKRLWQKWKLTITPNQKPCKYIFFRGFQQFVFYIPICLYSNIPFKKLVKGGN